MRGYFGIGIYHNKTEVNIGTLWRSAYSLGASFVFTIGRRYSKQASDTNKAWRHIPLYHYTDFEHFNGSRPYDAQLVAVELDDNSKPVQSFCHPEKSIYLLGAEDHGIPQEILNKCQHIVQLPGTYCLNVAVAGSIIMYDRIEKMKT